MAEYDPPQPLWKRAVAGILDLVLASAVFSVLIAQAFGGPCQGFVARRFRWCVSLNFYAILAIVALTVGYFAVLGRSGGTVFHRLFGMKRAREPSDVLEVVKLIVRDDEKRRVLICRRVDGRFSFFEEQRLRDLNGEPRWRPLTTFEAVSDSADAAELQARVAVGWLGLLRPTTARGSCAADTDRR
jgi:hypothetical protein